MRVREDERRSLARELHDEVGQLLTAAKFQIAAAQRSIDEQGGSPAVLDDLRPIVERALQTVRDLSHLLHPAVLDDLGLSAAVDLHIKEFRRYHGSIRVEMTETGLCDRLPREVETVAYRIVQEGLANIAKHARAQSCRVSLIRLSRSLMVVVGDDGAGFNQGQQRHGGLGLVSMRERVNQVGGSFVVESAPGRGTRIVAELPAPQVRQRPAEMPATA
jgi:signal transduction histidine kinase